jgi:hypothetical protein
VCEPNRRHWSVVVSAYEPPPTCKVCGVDQVATEGEWSSGDWFCGRHDALPAATVPRPREHGEHEQPHNGASSNGARPGSDAPSPSLTVRASDVRSRSIRWAWTGRLALGYLAVWTGIESVGKSVFAAWVIARLTHGELPGQFAADPVDVLVIASEDGIEDTWKPRLDLADADLERVHFIQVPTGWNVRDGIDILRRAMKATGARARSSSTPLSTTCRSRRAGSRSTAPRSCAPRSTR